MRRRAMGIATLAALSISIVAPGLAFAQAGPAATGHLTLYSAPGNSGDTRAVSYESCPYVTTTALGEVRSFRNAPAPGCLVTLVNADGSAHRLCAGRGTVPAPFTAAKHIRIIRGTSAPCPSE